MIEKEQEFLKNTETLIISLIEKYAKTNRKDLDVFSERRIKDIVKRSILSEKEFLLEDPITYKELYCEDQDFN
jgi:hypothetical protein